MIKIITLIITAAWIFSAGCSGDNSQDQQPASDTSLSGDPEGGAADDPLKQLQDEGKLPAYGTGTEAKVPVLPADSKTILGTGPQVESLPPPVDQDR